MQKQLYFFKQTRNHIYSLNV